MTVAYVIATMAGPLVVLPVKKIMESI